MAGFGTYETFAILEARGGINLDAYKTFEELLRAAMYKFCAQQRFETAALETMTKEIVGEIQKEAARVATCEACGDGIEKGDKYQPGYDGQCFCEKCAFSFAEAVKSWSEHVSEDDGDHAEACRRALADHVAAGGKPTDIHLIVAE